MIQSYVLTNKKKKMKKNNSFYLVTLLLIVFLYACTNSSNKKNNENRKNDTTTNKIINEVDNADAEVVDKIDFSKFEHYASILTKEDLIAQFGNENLKDQTMFFAEGTVEKAASVLVNPNNNHIINYIWKEDGNSTDWIEAHYNLFDENYEITGTQKIKAENGLYLGMSLKELVDWNGADFKFSGFGWDYGGTIYIDENSKMSKSPIGVGIDLMTYENAEFALGDIELSTDDERLKDLEIVITQFTMHIE